MPTTAVDRRWQVGSSPTSTTSTRSIRRSTCWSPSCLPTARTGRPVNIAATNAGIANAINALEDAGRAVSFVDTSSLTLADLTDGIHPNSTGYAKLASIWFDAIQDEVPHPSGRLHRLSLRRYRKHSRPALGGRAPP